LVLAILGLGDASYTSPGTRTGSWYFAVCDLMQFPASFLPPYPTWQLVPSGVGERQCVAVGAFSALRVVRGLGLLLGSATGLIGDLEFSLGPQSSHLCGEF
jgi:hypothetical protein